MTSLIARLEAATGPNDDLDDMIFAWEFGWDYPVFGAATSTKDYKSKEYNLAYTSSIDAAVALAERVLPGWGWRAQDCGTPAGVVVKGDIYFEARGSTPAIALCIAILKAKEATHDQA